MIQNVAILRTYISLSSQLTDLRIKPFNEPVRLYMLRFFNQALIDAILSHATSTDAVLKRSYDLYMLSFSNFLMELASPHLEVNVTDGGITRTESQNGKTAFAGQIKNLVLGYRSTGFTALENLILHLNENQSEFDDWEDSPAYGETSQLLFKKSVEFNRVVQLANPVITFRQLLESIESVQDMKIIPAIGQANFDLLLGLDDSASYAKKKILKYAQRATANYVLISELKKGNILVGPDGARVKSFDYNLSREIESIPSNEIMSFSLLEQEAFATSHMAMLKKLINADNDFEPIESTVTKSPNWM